jgi:hypothetical protein
MRLPELESPESYAGLYVFDFGGQVAVGYTADEIAVLLESERYADGKAYRIHRALPDGTFELQGVSHATFAKEDGLFFYRGTSEAARADFETLIKAAGDVLPPCRMKVQLAELAGGKSAYLTAIIFPAEFAHDVANWLNGIGFDGGNVVEGGPSQVTNYYEASTTIVERRQLWAADSGSRSAEEVLNSTHLPVQRKLA